MAIAGSIILFSRGWKTETAVKVLTAAGAVLFAAVEIWALCRHVKEEG